MNLNIPDVTVIAVSSIFLKETIDALEFSCNNINFGEVKLVAHYKPDFLPQNIKYEYCNKLNNIDDYNEYIFINLFNHVKTPYALLIQHDGYVINYKKWSNEFLEYDYIGAPWMWMSNSYICYDTGEHVRVGNGGFSLRSSKLLRLPKEKGWYLKEEQGWKNEDGNIACYWRKEMLENGIKYAPVEIAARFSYENDVPENLNIKEFFGFHKNDPRYRRIN